MVELSGTSALDNLEIASICGHRKECTHWLPEKEALAASLLPENVSRAAESHRVFELREIWGSISKSPLPLNLPMRTLEAQCHTDRDRAGARSWGAGAAFLIFNALLHLDLVLSKNVFYLK